MYRRVVVEFAAVEFVVVVVETAVAIESFEWS